MIALLTVAVLSQFKVNDVVYVTWPNTVHQTAVDAVNRANGVKLGYPHGKIIAVKDQDGEQVVRIKRDDADQPIWAASANVKVYDEKAKVTIRDEAEKNLAELKARKSAIEAENDQIAKNASDSIDRVMNPGKYKSPALKFCRNERETALITNLVQRGYDPMTMTAKESADILSRAQRQMLSGIKSRYRGGR